MRAADVHVEALRFRIVAGVAEMPLADIAVQVAALLERFGQRYLRMRQVARRDRRDQAAVSGRVPAFPARWSCAGAPDACR